MGATPSAPGDLEEVPPDALQQLGALWAVQLSGTSPGLSFHTFQVDPQALPVGLRPIQVELVGRIGDQLVADRLIKFPVSLTKLAT